MKQFIHKNAFLHSIAAAEKVEHALEKAVDDEVEVLFPHHKAEE